MSERKFDEFDEFAVDYRDIHNENIKISGADSDYFSKYKVIEVKKTIRDIKVEKILDLGCGDGNSVKFFREEFKNVEIHGVDISQESINVAKGKGLKNCFFEVYDGQNIPFEDNSFDLIFIAGVLHHVNRNYHMGLIKEVYRVLRKGGSVYIFEHNPYNPLTRKVVKDCIFDKDAVLQSASYTKGILRKAGFNDVMRKYTIFFPRSPLFERLLFLEEYLGWLPLGGQYYVKSVK